MNHEVSSKTTHSAGPPPPHQENVDPIEIAKFDARTARWWDIDGEFKLLHRINPLRLDYILERASGLFGKNVLDVGCGGGILAESMAHEGAKVTGLDMASASLVLGRLHALESGVLLNYRQETVEAHAETHSGIYDVVACMEMLEHVPNPASIVRSCARLVKPGGEVFLSTLNRNLKSWLMVILGAEYVLRILPRGTHDIHKFIRPAELLGWMDDTMLRAQHIIGLHYNPLRDCFYFGNGVGVHYMLHTRRLM